MTPQDDAAFSTLLAGLAEVFSVELTQTRAELYYRALHDIPLADLQAAAGRAIKELKFFPKPVELREFAQATVELEAETAWMTLLEGFQACDGYAFPTPDDPITRALIHVYWGTMARAWEWWRVVHDLGLEHKRDEFVERYQDYWHRPAYERPQLPGGRIFAELEAHHVQVDGRTPDGDSGRIAALPLPGLRDPLGVRVAREPEPVPRTPPASGPTQSQSPPSRAARSG